MRKTLLILLGLLILGVGGFFRFAYQVQRNPSVVSLCEDEYGWGWFVCYVRGDGFAPEVRDSDKWVSEGPITVHDYVVQVEREVEQREAFLSTDPGVYSFVIDTAEGTEFEEASEGVPPILTFYYDRYLEAVYIDVGHETWAKQFVYFYDSEGDFYYYRDSTFYRSDEPEDLVVVYYEGEIIHQTTDLVLSLEEIQSLYELGSDLTEDQIYRLSTRY